MSSDVQFEEDGITEFGDNHFGIDGYCVYKRKNTVSPSVRFLLRFGLFKSEKQATVGILLAVVLMLSVSTSFFYNAWKAPEVIEFRGGITDRVIDAGYRGYNT